MASPAFGVAGALAEGTGDSLAVAYPATINANDILVLVVGNRDDTAITTPTDFTLGDSRTQNTVCQGAWYWKRATGSESGSLTVERAASGGSGWGAVLYTVTGAVTTGTPFDLTAQTGLGNNATWTPADLDPVDAQDRLMQVFAFGNNDLLTAGNYTGGTATVTERIDVEFIAGLDGTLHVADAAHTADTAFDFGSQTTAAAQAHALLSIGWLPAGGVANADAEIAWTELEVPTADARADVAWAELEVPTANARAEIAWAEIEVPTADARAEVSWTELQTPSLAELDADAEIAWAELEVPTANAAAHVAWSVFEVPFVDAQAEVSWAEFEVPEFGEIVEVSLGRRSRYFRRGMYA